MIASTKRQRIRAAQAELYAMFKLGRDQTVHGETVREDIRKLQGVQYYRAGQCRNDPDATPHTYAEMKDGTLWPMCGYGWNRSNGARFSIFRGTPGSEGDCRICRENVRLCRSPVKIGVKRKTRWL